MVFLISTSEGIGGAGSAGEPGQYAPAYGKVPQQDFSIAYIVVAIVMSLMMFFSAAFKLMQNPGAVHVIHEVVGVPMSLLPVLAACEIAGGIGPTPNRHSRRAGCARLPVDP